MYPLIEGYCQMVGGNLDELAKILGITRRTLNNKLSGRTEFTLSEVKLTSEYCKQPIDVIFLPKGVPLKIQIK